MTGSSFFAGNGTNDVPFFIFACKTELYRSFLLPKSNYNPQIQISVVSGTKRSIFRQKNKTKRSKKKAAHNTYKAGAKG